MEVRELAFLVAHIPFGVFLRQAPDGVARLHALGIIALGVFWSGSPRTVHRTVLCAAYVAGAEVLWRMTGGTVVYEFGKYAVVGLLVLATIQAPRAGKLSLAPLGYFVLLLPSIMQTLSALGNLSDARREISFNLSGPVCLAACAFFFSNFALRNLPFRKLAIALAAPTLSVGAIAGRSTLDAGPMIRFTTQSNFVTSGGFGPNQVSAVLGLGCVVLMMLALRSRVGVVRLSLLAPGHCPLDPSSPDVLAGRGI